MPETDFPHALARKWQGDYAEHLFLTIALRDLVRRRVNRGAIRGLITARSVALLEITDQLAAFGLRPTLGLAGAESDLWAQTVRYASQVPWLSPPAGVHLDDLTRDLIRMQDAWNQFEAFAGELPEDFYETSVVLTAAADFRGEGFPQFFGLRVSPTVGEHRLERSVDHIGPTAVV